MLYILGVLNPNASLTGGRWLNIFLGGRVTLLMLCLASILLSRPKVVCKVYMRSRWVYHRSWRSVLSVSWLVVSVDGCIHYPWRRWWEILVLGGGNPGHRGLWLCVSGKRGLIVCWQGGGVNSGVGRDWCGWISGILCALGSRPFVSRYQCPGKGGGLLLLFPL